jgi:NADH-quinone oxidoreductase subunit N
MSQTVALHAPEVVLFVASMLVAVLGLSRSTGVRSLVPWVCVAALVASIVALESAWTPERVQAARLLFPMMGKYGKALVALIGIGLVAVSAGSIDRRYEEAVARGRAGFDALRVVRGEYYAFLLLSLCGAMLVMSAPDLIWLFLGLELVSLPTYIMVAVARTGRRSMEAAMKYFFLGALATAITLYGFAMLYGATGTLQLLPMRDALADQAAGSGLGTTALLGAILTVLGLCFKLAAVPMHFYAPDVYEGAPLPVTAFLSFTPKIAGFSALITVLGAIGWSGHAIVDHDGVRLAYDGLPQPVSAVLWMVAALTMVLGNIGGILQTSLKRTLAYSSIANSGYMLVGVIVGPKGGIGAMYLFMLGYGVMTVATFGVLAAIERKGEEVDSFESLAGLRATQPGLAFLLTVSALSLLGVPPLLGALAKIVLVFAAFEGGQATLAGVLLLNTAIGAVYYLRFVGSAVVNPPNAKSQGVVPSPQWWPRAAAVVAGMGLIVLPAFLSRLVDASATTVDGYVDLGESMAADDGEQVP